MCCVTLTVSFNVRVVKVFKNIQRAFRVRVVSNFGDRDCGAGAIHTRARNFEETRREGLALPSRHVSSKFRARARVYLARPTIAIAKIGDYSQSKRAFVD